MPVMERDRHLLGTEGPHGMARWVRQKLLSGQLDWAPWIGDAVRAEADAVITSITPVMIPGCEVTLMPRVKTRVLALGQFSIARAGAGPGPIRFTGELAVSPTPAAGQGVTAEGVITGGNETHLTLPCFGSFLLHPGVSTTFTLQARLSVSGGFTYQVFADGTGLVLAGVQGDG